MSNSKKVHKESSADAPKLDKKQVVVEPVAKAASPPVRRFNVSKIFWGAALVLTGVLLLLDNIGVINVNFMRLWQLWPVLIIGAGVSMLSLRGWLAALVSTVLVVMLGSLALIVAVENPLFITSQMPQTKTVTIGDAVASTSKGLDLTIQTGAINITVNSSATQREFSAELLSDSLVLNKGHSVVRDDIRFVTLKTESTRGWWVGPINNELRVGLNESLPLALHIETGASSLSGDLSATQLRSLDINAGASSIDFTLGDKQAQQNITIEGGASDITLRIPKAVGVRIDTDSGLTHVDFDGVEEKAEGQYQSTGFSTAEKQIIIHATLGASSFTVTRY